MDVQNIDNKTNLSDKQLKYAYWFLLHKKQLRQALIIVIILLDLLFLALAVTGLVKYLTNYNEVDTLYQNDFNYIDWAGYHQSNQPVDLQIGPTQAVSSGDNKIDIGVIIVNPNRDWAVPKLLYQFLLAGGVRTPVKEAYILPSSERYILELGIDSFGSSASLEIVDMDWQRVAKDSFIHSFDIGIDQVEYEVDRENTERTGIVNWIAKNNSAYGFWDVDFQIIGLSADDGGEVAFNSLTINSLDSLEEKKLTASWFQDLPYIRTVKIIPLVNLFDNRAIKK